MWSTALSLSAAAIFSLRPEILVAKTRREEWRARARVELSRLVLVSSRGGRESVFALVLGRGS